MMTIKKHKLAITGLTLLSALSLAACQSNSSDAKVVTGKDFSITEKDFYNEMKKQSGESVLNQMLLNELFKKEIGDDRYKEIEKQADETVASSKSSFGEDGFKQLLQQMSIGSEDAYRQNLIFYSLMNEVIPKYVSVSDDEIKKAYDDYQPNVDVSHILVKDESKAKEIIKELDDGKDFSELAKKNSEDSQTKDKGGSLGSLDQSSVKNLEQAFQDAMNKLKAGEYTKEPVKTSYGYHIIKVNKRDEKKSYNDMKDELTKQVKSEKLKSDNMTMVKAMHQLIEKYQVKINDKDLKSILDNYDPDKVEKKQKEAEEKAKESSEKAAKSSSDSSSSNSNSSASSSSESSSSEQSSQESSSQESSQSSK
ncbi:MAG: peptidylprolyl isomerase [Aerococcus sp.]|nr:peptidylprolyl isomerase [Aerococcus sp.]